METLIKGDFNPLINVLISKLIRTFKENGQQINSSETLNNKPESQYFTHQREGYFKNVNTVNVLLYLIYL